MTFQIHALPYEDFAAYFAMSDDDLATRNARRVVADADRGFPCRVSLEDARAGETLVLVNHASQTGASPYRAQHAVFVREGAAEAKPEPGEVPPVIRTRLMSLRAFDKDAMMIDADVCAGETVGERLDQLFARAEVREVHLHNAGPGCFAARVTRA